MTRTTVDIDAPILKDLKHLQKKEGKSLGRLVSDLLAQALSRLRSSRSVRPTFQWVSRPMKAKVDLLDKEAVRAAIDSVDETGPRS